MKTPERGQVLVRVRASGICHTDAFIQAGYLPNAWPLVPGHEIVGDVVAVGEGVTRFKEGDRVGGGWHGGMSFCFPLHILLVPLSIPYRQTNTTSHPPHTGHDGTCRSCQRGQFQTCDNQAINGCSFDGGYAEYCILRQEATVRVPTDLDPAEVAPLLCAGITVFNGIRKMHVEQGNLVAVQGLGGLGHMAVQYARAMGYRVAAVSRGTDKRAFALELGAHEYIDSATEDVAARLQELGGAALAVSTAPNGKAFSPLVGGLQPGGKLVIMATMGPVEFDTTPMVLKNLSVHGWPSGNANDSEETIGFTKSHGIKCLIEKFPLSEAPKAFELMKQGKPRFRNVLVMD